jgi:transcriptional regulator GlxA family with amidase domain
VAGKTSFAGFTPKADVTTKPRLVAVLAFDGVVLGDLATPCEVLARARTARGAPAYELRICSERPAVTTSHVSRHPRITVDANVLYVDNGSILTSAGAAAGLDLCLYLVRRDLGSDVAARTARAVVMPLERAGGQAQFISYESPNETGTAIGKLTEWIERNLACDLSLPVLARRAAMSSRTLCRRFREQVGDTPASFIARARLARARRLLETTDQTVEEIALAVGFRSATVLRDRFARLLGTTPRTYRQSFRPSLR